MNKIIYILIGIAIGAIIDHLIRKVALSGILHVDLSDPNVDRYWIEINDFDSLRSQNYIMLGVKHHKSRQKH